MPPSGTCTHRQNESLLACVTIIEEIAKGVSHENSTTMTCQNCRRLLTDYQHGELDAATDAALHEHLHACAACKAELDADATLTEALKSAFASELELPVSVLAGVRQAVHRERAPGIFDTLRVLLRPVVLAPTAAAVVLGAVLVSYLHQNNAPPQLSTDYFVQRHIAHTMDSQSGDRAWNAYLLTSTTDENANAGTTP